MLSIVSTPIGNLEDLSIRQAKTLLSSDIILAEDTRSAKKLLYFIRSSDCFKNLEDRNPVLRSYYKEKEMKDLPFIVEKLKEGKNISLTSDAGSPLVSDPGSLLMKSVILDNLEYEIIPGPSAVITSLIHSGFKTDKFMFIGFFPKKLSDLKKELKKIISLKKIEKDLVFIAFESPNRINKTLKTIGEVMPDSEIVIARELTKKFEEIYRGKPSTLFAKEYRGEITVIVK